MPFPRDLVETLLASVHRRCCICHRFCGVKIETDHMVPAPEGGTDDISNAIPVCFDCHAEIHAYNVQHPRGRRFTPAELQQHKQQWLEVCRSRPEVFVASPWHSDMGPLQALIDELEFNRVVAAHHAEFATRGALFAFEQFHRAIAAGSLAVLDDSIKGPILRAYASMSRANQRVLAEINQDTRGERMATGREQANTAMREAQNVVDAALNALLGFLAAGEAGGA